MSKREEHQQKLSEWHENWRLGAWYEGDDLYLLRTHEGTSRFKQAKEALDQLAEEARREDARAEREE